MAQHTYYFHPDVARPILEAMAQQKDAVTVSLDLNLSRKTYRIEAGCLVLDRETRLDKTVLEPILSAGQKIFILEEDVLSPLEIRSDGYYKLVPSSSVPTLEINGIKMHRTKTIDPLADAEQKANLVVKAGDRVLDTCGGLGYSALFAIKAGAIKVISIEKSDAVIRLRRCNPWLAVPGIEKIELICGDVTEKIQGFENDRFNSVIHDPPRFTSATGDLYGKRFYEALFRVMTPGARIFHYTGIPKKIKTGDRFIKNAVKRMETVGFKNCDFKETLQGIYAQKH